MVAEKWIIEMLGCIEDVNLKEIASHIADNTLLRWIESWNLHFRNLVKQVNDCYKISDGWIYIENAKPEEFELVQILTYNKSFHPEVYSKTGWCVKPKVGRELWISGSEIVEKVIAWKPLDAPLSLDEVKKLGWVEAD